MVDPEDIEIDFAWDDATEQIRQWHYLASNEDYFSRYVFEYLAFIAYVNTILLSYTRWDREAIQKLKRCNEASSLYLSKIKSDKDLKKNWNKIKNGLFHEPLENSAEFRNPRVIGEWWNFSGERLEEKTIVEQKKSAGRIHSLNDWQNMIEFFYTIRNNLFHGNKSPDNERDRFLVEFGYKTLRELVEIFISGPLNCRVS